MENQPKQPDSIEVSAMAVVLCNGKLLVTTEDIYGNPDIKNRTKL